MQIQRDRFLALTAMLAGFEPTVAAAAGDEASGEADGVGARVPARAAPATEIGADDGGARAAVRAARARAVGVADGVARRRR